jgi:sodium-dependent phosphate cotransporter|tara:strand:- start:770 stop:1264 length:495 start_codon:yes stop_codon:yes gene_type:complete
MKKEYRKLYDTWKYKKGGFMEFNNPVFQTLIGLVVFYIGLKMFSGGMKSIGHLEQLEWFLGNPYWMFLGSIGCTLLWQSSSLTTTAVIGLVASGTLPLPSAIAAILGANVGTTGTVWIAGMLVSDGMPTGITKQVALVHTGVNTVMAVALLPFIQPIARFISKF